MRKASKNSPISNVIEIDAQTFLGHEGSAGHPIIGDLEEVDRELRDYYQRRSSNGVELFHEYLNLLLVLKIATGSQLSGFSAKFSLNSDYHRLFDIAIGSVIRNLRIVFLLMSSGYFLESHAALRMVQQWLETALILEGNPPTASLIFKSGSYTKLPKTEKQKAISSTPEIANLHSGMMKTFGKLSERTHVTPTAINLSKFNDPILGELPLISGIISDEMWDKDTLALAAMGKNATNIFVRHFKRVPVDWETVRRSVDRRFDGLISKQKTN